MTSSPAGGSKAANCPHCGGGDLVPGIKVNQNAEVGRIGLAYKAAVIFVQTEQVYADLCRSCGTVARLFVKEPDRKWIQSGPDA
jgi:hypothetical protein